MLNTSALRALCLGLLATCLFAPASPAQPPDDETLRSADAYAATRRGLSLLVIQGDRVVFENYHNGSSAQSDAAIFSGTKGFWCVAAVIAAQEGILDLDEPVSRSLPAWRGEARKEDITVRDLLSFTGGLEPAFVLHGRSIPDRDDYSVRMPAVRPRGEAFTYGPSQLQVFYEVFKRKLAPHHLTPEEYLSHRLLRPLGIGDVDFRRDEKGNPLLASGFKITARQWSQFGRLILANGRYHGRQIVRPEYLAQCFQGTKANPMFGMGFWVNHPAGEPGSREVDIEKALAQPWQKEDWHRACLSHVAPRDLVASVGSGYQRMYIVPSEDLIVVRQGRDANFSDAAFLRLLFEEPRGHLAGGSRNASSHLRTTP